MEQETKTPPTLQRSRVMHEMGPVRTSCNRRSVPFLGETLHQIEMIKLERQVMTVQNNPGPSPNLP